MNENAKAETKITLDNAVALFALALHSVSSARAEEEKAARAWNAAAAARAVAPRVRR